MSISINAELRAEQYILSEQVRLIYQMLPYGLLATLAGLVVIKDTQPQKFSQAAIISAIIGLGNVNVIADGVETQAQIEWLKAVGCRKAQGPYFHPPMTGDDFGNLFGLA